LKVQIRIIPILLLVVLAFGCKGRLRPAHCDVKLAVFEETVQSTWQENFFDFDHLSIKMKAQFIDGKDEQSFTINAALIKDSIIWASISALGIEGVRVLIDKDSVKLYNRLKKTYFKSSTTFLEQFFGQPIGISELQQLLVGNAVFDYQNLKQGNNELYNDHLANQIGLARYLIQLNECLRIDRFVLEEKGTSRKLDAEYGQFVKIKKHGILPSKLEVNVKDGIKDVYFNLEYVSVNTDEIVNIPFRIPSRYAEGL